MFKHKGEKIVVALIMVILVMYGLFINYASAAINEKYYESAQQNSVPDTQIETKVGTSWILDVIGKMVYGVASLLEWLLGALFQSATGTNIFPWADIVVFNAVPLLDANFINPDSRSLVSTLSNTISKIYSTVFGLATTFFVIAIAFMALKLVVSTIAEKKASYKQAIVQWIMGLLLLYSMHFFMSFCLYLNEQFVEIASQMVDVSDEISKIEAVPLTNEQLVDNFFEAMDGWSLWEVLTAVGSVITGVSAVAICFLTGPPGWLTGVLVAGGIVTSGAGIMVSIGSIDITLEARDFTVDEAKEYIKKDDTNINLAATLLKNSVYTTHVFEESGAWYDSLSSDSDGAVEDSWKHKDEAYIRVLAGSVYVIRENSLEDLEDVYYACVKEGTSDTMMIAKTYKIYIETCREVMLKKPSTVSLYSNLGQFFKASSFSFTQTGWRASKVVLQNALLYAIFVVQSVIFFISYIRRMLYIVIFGLMSPLVVVGDFFKRT